MPKDYKFEICDECVCFVCTHNGVTCDACGTGCSGTPTYHCAIQLVGVGSMKKRREYEEEMRKVEETRKKNRAEKG